MRGQEGLHKEELEGKRRMGFSTHSGVRFDRTVVDMSTALQDHQLLWLLSQRTRSAGT